MVLDKIKVRGSVIGKFIGETKVDLKHMGLGETVFRKVSGARNGARVIAVTRIGDPTRFGSSRVIFNGKFPDELKDGADYVLDMDKRKFKEAKVK